MTPGRQRIAYQYRSIASEECVRAHLRFYVGSAGQHAESKRRSVQPSLAEHDSRRASLRAGHADGNQIVDQKSAIALHASLCMPESEFEEHRSWSAR